MASYKWNVFLANSEPTSENSQKGSLNGNKPLAEKNILKERSKKSEPLKPVEKPKKKKSPIPTMSSP